MSRFSDFRLPIFPRPIPGERRCGSHDRTAAPLTPPKLLQDEVHLRVLRLLQDNPELSQRALADALGVSLGSVNFQLKALIEKGLVKLGNFSANPDKRRYAYILTPKGIAAKAALTRRFLARKRAEYCALKAEIDALQDEVDAQTAPRK